jgi:DNA repair protein SbcC/Rad50
MRILRISLRNIASLAGTHTIDFTRDPLRATGLFSICGSTGSGKSTLLDALCLALYERTPRLDVVRGAIKLPDGSDLISQSDPANLLRRGAGEGFSEVAFVGVDRATYTARWKVRRAHNRCDGALQKAELTLFRGDVRSGTPGVIEQGGKKSEVLPAIAAKVGLSFEQFTRAVLLAQNDFATFLKADDKERAEILQALTGTERFDAISRSVFDRFSTRKKEIEFVETQLAANSPMEPAQRAEAESALAVVEEALKEATERLAIREKHAEWHRRLLRLSWEVAGAQASLDRVKNERNSSAPRRLELVQTEKVSRESRPLFDAHCRAGNEAIASEKFRDEAAHVEAQARDALHFRNEKYAAVTAALSVAESALEAARPQLREARDLDANLRSISEQLVAATHERTSVETNLNHLIERRDALMRDRQCAEAELRSLFGKRESLAWLVPFASEAAGWIARIDRAIDARAALTDSDRELTERAQEERQKMELCHTERAKESRLRAEAELAVSALAKAESAARFHDSLRISFERRQAESALAALHDVQNHLVRLEWLSGRAQHLKSEINKLGADNEVDRKTLVDLKEDRIPAAVAALKSARYSFELAEAAVADAAIRLREKLAPGFPCPVCGALDHPYGAHLPTIEAAALRGLREDCFAKEKMLAALYKQEAELHTGCNARKQQVIDRTKSLQEIVSELETLHAARYENPEAAAIFRMPAAGRAEAVLNRVMALDKVIDSLDSDDRARLAAEKELDAARANRDNSVQQLAIFEKRLREIESKVEKIESDRESAETVRKKQSDMLRACLEQLDPLLASCPNARSEWEVDEAAFQKKFCRQIAEFQAQEKRIRDLHSVIRECEVALDTVSEVFDRVAAEHATKLAAEALARSLHDDVRAKRIAIFGGRPADEVEMKLENNLRSVKKTRDDCAEEFAKAERDFLRASHEHKAALKASESINARLQTAGIELDAWLAGFAAQTGRNLDRPALQALLSRDDAWITAERTVLDALENATSKAEGALSVHKQAYEDHVAARPTIDDEAKIEADLVQLRSAQAELVRRRDAARTPLHADDQLQATRASLARQLESRRSAFVPWEKLNELIGSADGAKFRSIAQRRTLDLLLRYANVQLNQIAGRYVLARVPESLNLVVLDRDMGEERRSVHTLSGGETFLVSLALALGLASLTSNRLRIESLFIDEGFGSLDPETLNTAMGALMSLEAQGRKVGIISHVPEMADAIPVQIRVVKGRNGASRIIVPGAVPE